MNEQLLTLAASLAAVLGLAGLALWLGLGREPRLTSEADAQRWANEVSDGFVAREVALDQNGKGAILCNDAGDIMILKPHGSHCAGRILDAGSQAQISGSTLTIDCGEAPFGKVQLTLAHPEIWADAINALGYADHA